MHILNLDFDKEATDAMLALSVKIELNDQRQFKPLRSREQLIEMLEYAFIANTQDVQDALFELMQALSADDIDVLRMLGIKWLTKDIAIWDKKHEKIRSIVKLKTMTASSPPYASNHVYRDCKVA